MNGWKAEKAKERQGAVAGVVPGKSFPRYFPTIRYHDVSWVYNLYKACQSQHEMVSYWSMWSMSRRVANLQLPLLILFHSRAIHTNPRLEPSQSQDSEKHGDDEMTRIAFILFAPGPLSGCWHVLTSGEKESRLQHKSLRCFWPLSTILSGSEPQDNNTFLEIFDFT